MFKIYNTLTSSKEVFRPINRSIVRMYVCGPTVYDKTHIGHAKAYISFDVLRRYLEFKGYNVLKVVNITDIDDKIIRKAIEMNVDYRDVAKENYEDFIRVCEKLNIRKAHVYPKATEHIEEMIKIVEKLIEKGYAYEVDGNVYFNVRKFRDYGKLSKINIEQMKTQEEAPGKINPQDFALWKKAKIMEPYWNSPWGPGRPGWHIECSAMSSKYLGKQFDIHGGGEDLIFPHHENEIAQSEACFEKKPWVKYWVHVGLLMMGKDKMSKSLGNIITVEEITKKYSPMEFRFYIISGHYRSQTIFQEESLEAMRNAYKRIINTISILKNTAIFGKERTNDDTLKNIIIVSRIRRKIIEAMDDDLNTPKALAELHKLTSFVNDKVIPSENAITARLALKIYSEMNEILGVFKEVFEERIEEDKRLHELINLLISIRQIHRARKEWEIADLIAKNLRDMGIEISDQKDKTIWWFK
ncbi:MAG: cysteine--tRNA ligase [Candidatus Methanomethylicia archaeon]